MWIGKRLSLAARPSAAVGDWQQRAQAALRACDADDALVALRQVLSLQPDAVPEHWKPLLAGPAGKGSK
jgi:hypothetical protein